MKPRLLYFSRGRGYGHAVKDLVAVDTLSKKIPEIQITFASYADGLNVLRPSGFDLREMAVDLDQELLPQVIVPIINAMIDDLSPDLIVSHEVFFAPLVARQKRIRSLLLTHWFFSQVLPKSRRIDYIMGIADRILILDIERFHSPPHKLRSKTSFAPILSNSYTDRPMPSCSHHDISQREYILVSMGGRIDFYTQLLELVIDSLGILRRSNRLNAQVVIVAPTSAEYFKGIVRRKGLNMTEIIGFQKDLSELQANALFVIGRGSFSVMSELAALGTPSLQLITGDNDVDIFHAENFENLGTVKLLQAFELSVEQLACAIEDMVSWSICNKKRVYEAGCPYRKSNGSRAFATIVEELLQ